MDLSGPLLKLNWASYHLNELCGAVGRFVKSNPFMFSEEADPTGDDSVLKARMAGKAPTAEFGVRVGDFAHNARSALDHIVYQLSTLSGSDTKRRKLQFPICDSAATYENSEDRLLDGVADLERQIIERYQPCNASNGYRDDPLRMLREINNTDKHRLIPVVAIAWQIDSVRFGDTGITSSGDAKVSFSSEAHGFFPMKASMAG